MFKKIMFVCITALLLSGCSPDNSGSNNKDEEITTLNTQVSSLQNQINQLQTDLSQVSSKISQINESYAIFTPSSKGYVSLYANVGYFIVSLDSLKKYANGYRATFSIGNPNVMTFNGVKVQVQWGEAYTKDKNLNDWINSLKSEEVDINKPLLPGIWNRVTVVLSPATANETGFISLSLVTNQVYLNPDLRGNSN